MIYDERIASERDLLWRQWDGVRRRWSFFIRLLPLVVAEKLCERNHTRLLLNGLLDMIVMWQYERMS